MNDLFLPLTTTATPVCSVKSFLYCRARLRMYVTANFGQIMATHLKKSINSRVELFSHHYYYREPSLLGTEAICARLSWSKSIKKTASLILCSGVLLIALLLVTRTRDCWTYLSKALKPSPPCSMIFLTFHLPSSAIQTENKSWCFAN